MSPRGTQTRGRPGTPGFLSPAPSLLQFRRPGSGGRGGRTDIWARAPTGCASWPVVGQLVDEYGHLLAAVDLQLRVITGHHRSSRVITGHHRSADGPDGCRASATHRGSHKPVSKVTNTQLVVYAVDHRSSICDTHCPIGQLLT